jgi:non-specific serine/threonine protein kinase
MHAVLDASYQLCSAQERLLWAWLSVFPGEFDLPAAESVCTGEGITGTEVMDLLAGLVDKSVVTVTRQDRSRRRLLDIIREYGQLRLAELGQRDALAARHAAYYRD